MAGGREQLPIHLTTGGGALGTGIHLVWSIADSAQQKVAEVWATLLFFPVVPLGTWVLERPRGGDGPWGVRTIRPPLPAKSILTAAVFYGGAVLALLPAYITLELFMGRQMVGIAGLLTSAALILGTWAWLDSTRERIPLRAAFSAYSARGTLGQAAKGAGETS